MESEHIYFRELVDALDIRTEPTGRKKIRSIKFVEKSGKLRFIPQCYIVGPGKMNAKIHRMRGVQPCSCDGSPEGHIIAVNIRKIVAFNNREVKY